MFLRNRIDNAYVIIFHRRRLLWKQHIIPYENKDIHDVIIEQDNERLKKTIEVIRKI